MNLKQRILLRLRLFLNLKYTNVFFDLLRNIKEILIEENKEIKEKIDKEISKLSNKKLKKEKIKSILSTLKQLTLSIKFPKENEKTIQLKNKLQNFGIPEKNIENAYNSIKKVWSSKYNERVYLSMQKLNLKYDKIKISILTQKIIPSEYAFVIHTKNPINNNKKEIFSEIVNGMGETLVGSYEGQSFSFIYNKIDKKYNINSYQNKSVKLLNSGFIFRSDSNIEDLEDFSGAGLFDSVCLVNDKIEDISYCDNLLFNDKKFVNEIIEKISSLGIGVEKLCGCEQDIEGFIIIMNF